MIDLDELERRRAAAEGMPWMSPEWLRYTATLRFNAEELIAMARRYQWGVKNARWLRHEHEAYVAIPVASDADLSCEATRHAAIDAAMQEQER